MLFLASSNIQMDKITLHKIPTIPNDYISKMIAMNYLHLVTHDIDHHPHHCFRNDQEIQKKVCLYETH